MSVMADITSVEPFEVEVCACKCHSGEVNTCPFKNRNVFNRQLGGTYSAQNS